MALRKYNFVRSGESSNHTSNGFIVPRGSGTGGGGGTICPTGYHWDTASQTCVPDDVEPPTCPDESPWFNGFYCTQYGECPEGYHLVGNTCVPDEDPPPEDPPPEE